MNNELNNNEQNRRDFLKKFGSAVAGITIIGSFGSILQSCSSTTATDLGAGADGGKTLVVDVSSLTADNTAVHATAPASSRGLLVVRKSSTSYETILLVCPHENCSYPNVDLSGSTIICNCHNSRFDLNGTVTSGPSQSNLTRFTTTYDASTKKATVTF